MDDKNLKPEGNNGQVVDSGQGVQGEQVVKVESAVQGDVLTPRSEQANHQVATQQSVPQSEQVAQSGASQQVATQQSVPQSEQSSQEMAPTQQNDSVQSNLDGPSPVNNNASVNVQTTNVESVDNTITESVGQVSGGEVVGQISAGAEVSAGIAKKVGADAEVSVESTVESTTESGAKFGGLGVENISKKMGDIQANLSVPDFLKPVQGQPLVSSDEKVWGLVCYIPLMSLIALILKPSSDFIKLHGRQGLLIFLIFFFSGFFYIFPFIGIFLGGVIHFVVFIIGVFSAYQAFVGNWWKIPVLGDVSELIPLDLFAKVTREAVVGAKVSEEIEQRSIEEQQAKADEQAFLDEIQAQSVVSDLNKEQSTVPVNTSNVDSSVTDVNQSNDSISDTNLPNTNISKSTDEVKSENLPNTSDDLDNQPRLPISDGEI